MRTIIWVMSLSLVAGVAAAATTCAIKQQQKRVLVIGANGQTG
jgi:Na+-transporting NADH:ubiquinone oxidoreductase subunit NqrC